MKKSGKNKIIDNNVIEQFKEFNYLGCIISPTKEADIQGKQINQGCGTVWKSLSGKVNKEALIKLYKAMTVCIGIYASETWTISKKDKQHIQSAEMRFLRWKHNVKKIKTRNEHVRPELNVSLIRK